MPAARAPQRPLRQIRTSSFVSTTDDPVVRDPQCECARSLDLYWRTQRVIREHRDIQGTLFHAGRITDGASRRTPIEAAAERVAAGEDLFAVRCCLTIDLARRGMGQVLLPTMFAPRLLDQCFDPSSCTAQGEGARYAAQQDRTAVDERRHPTDRETRDTRDTMVTP